jgi:hypothetical protein
MKGPRDGGTKRTWRQKAKTLSGTWRHFSTGVKMEAHLNVTGLTLCPERKRTEQESALADRATLEGTGT